MFVDYKESLSSSFQAFSWQLPKISGDFLFWMYPSTCLFVCEYYTDVYRFVSRKTRHTLWEKFGLN